MIFAFGAAATLFHIMQFFLIVSHKFAQFGQDMKDYEMSWVAEAAVVVEVVSLLPIVTSFYGAHDRVPWVPISSGVGSLLTLFTYLHTKAVMAESWLMDRGTRGMNMSKEDTKDWQVSIVANHIFTVMDWIIHGILTLASFSYAHFLQRHNEALKEHIDHEETFSTPPES